MLRKKPGFAAVAILTLALGIGATTAIFSVVNGVLLRPLPYADPDELVMVWQDYTRIGGPIDEWADPNNFFDWRDHNEVFDGMFVLDGFAPTLIGVDEPRMLNGAAISYNAFDVMGIEPLVGRGFFPEEDTATGEFVVVLGYSFWQRHFNADEAVLGSTINFSGGPATIVGVMPEDFAFPVVTGGDIFAPLRIDETNACGRQCVTLRAIARMSDGVSLAQAQSNMEAVAARLAEEHAENRDIGIYLEPLADRVLGAFRGGLWMLLGAVGFVLLIVCANVANLMLARATGRQREVAIRVAMGAGRGRVFRQMLTESVMLALAGAAIGVVVALWGVDLLVALIPAGTTVFESVAVDRTALAFTLLIGMGTGLLFGLVPALRAARPQFHDSLKEGTGGAGSGLGGQRYRSTLVVAEVALALMLLIGGGLMLRSFVTLITVDPGFDADNVLTQQIFLPATSYGSAPLQSAFVDELVGRVENLPAVESAGVINTLPLAGNNVDTGFVIEGRPREPGARAPVTWYRPVTPDYFTTMRMRLARGRWFDDRDHGEAPQVVMINEAAVRRYWPDEDPVGARITFGGENYREVIGVVGDTKHFGLDQDERPATYLPFAQTPRPFMSLVVRTSGDPMALARSVQAEVRDIDSDLAVSGVASMRDVVSGTVAFERLVMALLVGFAGSAMTLAAIGIYGVMSYNVEQRTQEIGVRVALGADRGDVLKLVVGKGMRLTLAGVGIGLVASLALSRFLESLLFEVSATDPWTFVLVPVALALVSLLASYIPARRASRVDPIVALRYE